MKKFDRGELAKNILLGLAAGGLIVTVCVLPGMAHVLELFKPKDNRERYRIKQSLHGLQKRKFVRVYSKDGKEVFELTEKGKTRVFKYKIDDMQLKRPKKWDGLWRVVSFDIPEKKKRARDTFNFKLKDLNFYPLQKSIFVTPYECKDEIDFISHYYFVEKDVLYFKAKEISSEETVKKYFHL